MISTICIIRLEKRKLYRLFVLCDSMKIIIKLIFPFLDVSVIACCSDENGSVNPKKQLEIMVHILLQNF